MFNRGHEVPKCQCAIARVQRAGEYEVAEEAVQLLARQRQAFDAAFDAQLQAMATRATSQLACTFRTEKRVWSKAWAELEDSICGHYDSKEVRMLARLQLCAPHIHVSAKDAHTAGHCLQSMPGLGAHVKLLSCLG